jgi:catechol 2,3-dioxygenase-like lactoylglutathione lyase family enzyme
MKLILQQAQQPGDVRPNRASAKRNTYPTDWQGPDSGWDTFVHVDSNEFDLLVEEMRAKGANIVLGPMEATHSNGMHYKNLYIQDPDGYIIGFG